MHQDLNDLYYFVQAVEGGGFAQAGRALAVPKSKLSRRIAKLEERLGVRLIQRSSRHFAVTELGQAYYLRCKEMLLAADAAQAVIDTSQSEPRGVVRLACPIGLLHAHFGSMLADFALHYPSVTVQLTGMNRAVDVLAEGLDLAIRMKPLPLDDSELAMRVLGYSKPYLVASPELLARHGRPCTPADLLAWPSLGYGPPMEGHAWLLQGPDGEQVTQRHEPCFITTDQLTLRHAAINSVGVVQLPSMMIGEALAAGQLIELLPDWSPRREVIHLVFATRRGLLPAVRALIDFLAERCRQLPEG
jgi:DNA-binding transcriptional LysR family regulator